MTFLFPISILFASKLCQNYELPLIFIRVVCVAAANQHLLDCYFQDIHHSNFSKLFWRLYAFLLYSPQLQFEHF